MTTIHLDQQLSGHVFAFMLVFSRLGAALMQFPGFGEAFVSPRIRLMFALLLSFLLLPVLLPHLPKQPEAMHELARMIGAEILIGLFFGSLLRLFLGTIETAGAIIAVQIGLSNAMILNPALATQSALPSAFMGMAAVVLLFVTGLDHILLKGLFDTYSIFPPGVFPSLSDIVRSYTHNVGQSFKVGVEIAGPFLVMGLLLYVALGFMQRMMPQVQLFMVAMPLQIWGGLVLFAAMISAMLSVWLRYFDGALTSFFTL